MKLKTKTFARGTAYQVQQNGNQLNIRPRKESQEGAGSRAASYDIELNSGQLLSTVTGQSENGERVELSFSYSASGVTVNDESKPGSQPLAFASPENYAMRSKEQQQTFAMNVVSSIIGIPIAFNPEQVQG
ncbi:MAG: hypothetical protein WC314_07740 [Vulcanimicrobiota bacterium]